MRRAFSSAVLILLGVLSMPSNAEPGIVVLSLADVSAGREAGLQVGDVITGWSYISEQSTHAADTVVPLASPFDLTELELEIHPITPVHLHAVRDGKSMTVSPDEASWRITARPNWPDQTAAALEHIDEALGGETAEAGLELVQELTDSLRADDDLLGVGWIQGYIANHLIQRGDRPGADVFFGSAIDTLESIDHAPGLTNLWYWRGVNLMRLSQFDEATAAMQRSIDTHQSIAVDRIGEALALRVHGAIETRRGNLDAAEAYLLSALEILQVKVPGSLRVAGILGALGLTDYYRGNIGEAEAHYIHAAEIGERVEPDGGAYASFLNGLGGMRRALGDEAGAEAAWRKSLAIERAIDPESRDVSTVMHNLAMIAAERGHLQDAEEAYLRSLQMLERDATGTTDVATMLNNLGSTAMGQGNLAAAEDYHRRAYKIRAAQIPDSLDFSVTQMNLGNVARQRGRLDEAESLYRAALDIRERLTPLAAHTARIWFNIGVLEQDRAGNAAAAAAYQNALEIFSNNAPRGRGVAEVAIKLGELALQDESPDKAEIEFRRGLEIFAVIAPQTFREAQALHGLARVQRARQDTAAARSYYERSLTALEAQHARVGGSEESRSAARERHLAPYRDYVEYLLELGDREYAFDVLERSRSRVLLDLLSERDLILRNDVPAELQREQRVLGKTYERLQSRLYEAESTEQVEDFMEQLRNTRREQEQLLRRIAATASPMGALRSATSIRFANLPDTVRPVTAIVSYMVGAKQTQVFAVSADHQLLVETLPVGERDIEDLVTRYRYLLDAGRWDEVPSDNLNALAERLYRTVLLPVEDHIADADRILIVPEGALAILPFAALRRPVDGSQSIYVAEWRPTITVSALSVYAHLRQPSTAVRTGKLVAFGSPDYSQLQNDDEPLPMSTVAMRTARSRLTALPYSGEEVNNIADIFGQQAIVYRDADATEERAKAVDSDARYLHIAAHALLNEAVPLDTAIALSIPGDDGQNTDNGFLHVWEIYESLRLSADLVALSACETALGREYSGEGLLGLTRAFHYAGASTVLASLWVINDRSTNTFMTRFYQLIKQGYAQDDALQRAQLDMLRGADRSVWKKMRAFVSGEDVEQRGLAHPYRWAGFVLHGRGE